MDIELEKAHRRARMSSLVAALLMLAIAALCAAMLALYLYAQSRVGSYEHLQHGWIENKIASLTMPVLASLLFASFFLHIHRSEKPFGSSQSLKLGIAGVLLSIKYALDCIRPGIPPIPVPHINGILYIEQQGTADPTVLVLIAFTIALAIVLRYANALQEDSDSIL